MEQEKGNFKGRIFGGFNRHDVIDYIERLAGERNDLARENEELRDRVEALEERLDSAGTEDMEPRETAARVLEEARQILAEVKAEYDGLCGDVSINLTQAGHELGTVTAKLTALQITLSAAGERLEAVSGRLTEEADKRAESI